MSLDDNELEALRAELSRAQTEGFLGPADIEVHVSVSLAFLDAANTLVVSLEGLTSDSLVRGVDLGSGGGVPGFAVALGLTDVSWSFVEASERRARYLRTAIRRLSLTNSAAIFERMEDTAARQPGSFEIATARGFGPPAETAECAAPLLVTGGVLLVSEPPEDRGRWNLEGLAELGLVDEGSVGSEPAIRVLRKTGDTPPRFPRSAASRRRDPLF